LRPSGQTREGKSLSHPRIQCGNQTLEQRRETRQLESIRFLMINGEGKTLPRIGDRHGFNGKPKTQRPFRSLEQAAKAKKGRGTGQNLNERDWLGALNLFKPKTKTGKSCSALNTMLAQRGQRRTIVN